jgi:hypothetical protein
MVMNWSSRYEGSTKYFLALVLLLFLAACATKKDYIAKGLPVDKVAISINGAAPSEETAFYEYFRKYINKEAGYPLVADRNNTGGASHILRISITDKQREFAGYRHSYGQFGGSSSVMHYYSYQTRLELVRANSREVIWSWSPEEWKTFTNYKKSIKWLADYCADYMADKGLLKPEQYLEQGPVQTR